MVLVVSVEALLRRLVLWSETSLLLVGSGLYTVGARVTPEV